MANNTPKRPTRWELLRQKLHTQSGQAMAEYSAITWGFLAPGAGIALITFVPKFMAAMDKYLDNVYKVINAALG